MHNKIFSILVIILSAIAAFFAGVFWMNAKTDIQLGFAVVITIQSGALFLKGLYSLTKKS